MAIDIELEKFKKMLEQMAPSLALVQNDGIPLHEAKEKLLALYIEQQRSQPESSLADKIQYICYYFKDWLENEKKIPDERIVEVSRSLYKLLMDAMTERLEKLENRELGYEAKKLTFPKIK
jgi:hypothetical protein